MKTNTWQLQEAKNHFSEVVSQACAQGVQTITKHGKPVAVVVEIGEFQKLKPAPKKKKPTLLEVLQSCPYPEIFDYLEKSREVKDYGRTIDCGR